MAQSKSALAKHAVSALESEFITPDSAIVHSSAYPWRDEDDPFFTPQPLDRFLFEQMGGIKLYPKQEEDLAAFLGIDPKMTFEPDTGLTQQAVLCYGKGAGKDFLVSCVMVWAVHVLLCLKAPALYLGQAPDENIDILTVAYSLVQAKTVLFFKMKQRIKSCAWLPLAIEKLTRLPGDRYLKDSGGFVGAESIIFPGNIRLWSVPATDAAEGKNPILWCADEIAAFASPVRVNQAQHIHRLLVSSARTRFQNRWKGFLISFPRHKGDYLMQQIDLHARGMSPDTYAVVRPTWEVNLSVTRESLQVDYDRDPEGSVCRYECNPPAAVDSYFRSPELLLLNCSGAPLPLLRSKLSLPEEALEEIANRGLCPITDLDGAGDPMLDDRGFPKLAAWFRGQKKPSGEPYDYYIHLDPGATNDSFGFAMGHNHEMPNGSVLPTIDLAFRWTGTKFAAFGTIYRPQWFEDTPATTEQIQAAEIDFRTVREFIFYLAIGLKFNIVQVSFDSWNSVESRQELEKRGFQTALRVVAKQDYDEFKELAYNRQIDYYAYPILIEECLKLQIVNGTKVDAPRSKEGEGIKDDSHKDVSDAVAAVSRYLKHYKGATTELWEFKEDTVNRFPEVRLAEPSKEKSLDLSRFTETQRSLFDDFLDD